MQSPSVDSTRSSPSAMPMRSHSFHDVELLTLKLAALSSPCISARLPAAWRQPALTFGPRRPGGGSACLRLEELARTFGSHARDTPHIHSMEDASG